MGEGLGIKKVYAALERGGARGTKELEMGNPR